MNESLAEIKRVIRTKGAKMPEQDDSRKVSGCMMGNNIELRKVNKL